MNVLYKGRIFTVDSKQFRYELYSDKDGYFIAKHIISGHTFFVGSVYKTYNNALKRLHVLESAVTADHLPERY